MIQRTDGGISDFWILLLAGMCFKCPHCESRVYDLLTYVPSEGRMTMCLKKVDLQKQVELSSPADFKANCI